MVKFPEYRQTFICGKDFGSSILLKYSIFPNWHDVCNVFGMEAKGARQTHRNEYQKGNTTMSNSNFASQAFAFALALLVSVSAFGVTVAPDHNDEAAPVAAQIA
ncbi:hypothetical protein [Croceicoccus sp. Ery15]|uniref:hypothetical protein n=1 Tax=Croceicoccus sp. Ery15 TaxID=1703338 RepID=UPI001E4C72F7|nr:hypothetical protein [Croceicoccus sp. Ery15]